MRIISLSAALILFTLQALIPLAASAANKKQTIDENEAITIEADRMRYDNSKQTNIFSGNVLLIRGGFEIRAQKIEMRQDEAGNQFATAIGSPATFKRKQVGAGASVEGSGKELRYADESQTLQILDGATLRRVNAGEVSDEVHGAKIVYQGRRDFFTVEGGDKGRSSANPRGRVRVVIQPRAKSESDDSRDATALKPSGSIAQ